MKSVLIVDDSLFMRDFIKKILIKHGYSVVGEAENGRIGLELYKELRPDAVTLDITMKEMTGLEALKEILKFDPNAKAIMLSAMGQQTFVQEAIDVGAKGFLIKPLNENMVVSTVAKLIGQ